MFRRFLEGVDERISCLAEARKPTSLFILLGWSSIDRYSSE
jgi:hypothetical protein